MYTVKVMDTDGVVSVVAGNGANGYSDGVGATARLSSAVSQLYFCRYNDVDIIYMADSNNNLIRSMTTAGLVSTIAGGGGGGNVLGSTNAVGTYAKFNYPQGVACDSGNGDVWVVDTVNYVIRKIAYGTNAVTTVAGKLGTPGAVINGVGANAQFSSNIWHIAQNPNSRCFYVTDHANHVIRQITTSGLVSTFAGTAGINTPFLDAIGTYAVFSYPVGIAIDPTNGNIVVGDYDNNRIRVIDSATATVTVVAGNGVQAASNGMGTYAQVIQPFFNYGIPRVADRIKKSHILVSGIVVMILMS